MDKLLAMKVFTKVVEMNSFARAADALDIPRASATTIIKNLEANLHTRLMQRTTRRLNLTPEGAGYYERCVRVLADIDEIEDSLANVVKGPRGKLRVDMPGSLGRLIVMPRLEEFRERYPHVELMLGFGDRHVDLIQEGVDCALRVGNLDDSTLVARRLGALSTITAASPAYLARYGEPRSLEELEQHVAVHYFSSRTGRTLGLNFDVNGESRDMKMNGGRLRDVRRQRRGHHSGALVHACIAHRSGGAQGNTRAVESPLHAVVCRLSAQPASRSEGPGVRRMGGGNLRPVPACIRA